MNMAVNFAEKVFNFTKENHLFSAPCHVLVGVSGGADSMALLHVLAHWPVAGLHASAVHIHHGLRGEYADRDEDFVRQFCDKEGINLSVFHEDVSALSNSEGLTIEEAGRRIRYADFEKCRQSVGADYVLTAHTASDQVETVLMRIIRGTGIDGLAGISVANGLIRRPLLCCSREEVESYCKENGLEFVTDETNGDVRFTRNRIRHELMPLLRQINPAVNESILRLHHHAQADSTYLRKQVDCILRNDATPSLTDLKELPSPLLSRVISTLLVKAGVTSYDQYHIQAITEVISKGNGTIRLPGNLSAVAADNCLQIVPTTTAQKEVFDPIPVTHLPFAFKVNEQEYFISLTTHRQNVHSLFATYALDYDKIQGAMCIRNRREGDTIHPAGRGVGKSLKKLFNEYKIPVADRDGFPLLCDEQGVVLIPGYTCDQRVRITEDTKHFLVWQEPTEQG